MWWDILFPENITCIFCNLPISKDNWISSCKACYEKLAYIQEICIHCGRHGRGARMCTHCAQEKYAFDRVFCVLEYNDFMHHTIYAYKYGYKTYFVKYFAEILRDFLDKQSIDYDFVTGVPISSARMRQRGFNQSYLMAQKLDDGHFIELFERVKDTHFLSGFSRARRMAELEDAFEIRISEMDKMLQRYYGEREYTENQRKIKLLIVDDILTTGSTFHRLSQLAKKHIHNLDITVVSLCGARKML